MAHKIEEPQIIGKVESLKRQSFDYTQAFARNDGLISQIEQARLKHSRIAIPGLGGVGGVHLMTLVRMGIGKFHIADADQFSIANFNRQYGANLSTVGKDKTKVMKAMLQAARRLENSCKKCHQVFRH